MSLEDDIDQNTEYFDFIAPVNDIEYALDNLLN
jgi:hypothetical protein